MIIERQEWTAETAANLKGLCGDDEAYWRSEVERGNAQLYQVTGEETNVWLVIRFEKSIDETEIVVCFSAGHGMKSALDLLKKLALDRGIKKARFHATNPAVQRLYCRYGFDSIEVERVYKMNLEH